jgi:hypothetical protein
MDIVNLYVVLGAPARGNLTLIHHEEIAADAYEQLRAGYEPAELPAAVIVASEWLARALGDRESDRSLLDDDDRDALTLEEEAALHVLLGCLAVETQASIAAGARWAVMDVRYYDDEAHVTVASSAVQPADLA